MNDNQVDDWIKQQKENAYMKTREKYEYLLFTPPKCEAAQMYDNGDGTAELDLGQYGIIFKDDGTWDLVFHDTGSEPEPIWQ